MKLSAQYSRVNLFITVAVLFVTGIVYYYTINYIANNQLDASLSDEIEEVTAYVKLNQQLPKPVDFDADQTSFIKTNEREISRSFFDTTYNNQKEKTIEPGRAVVGLITLKGVNYKIVVAESKEATEDLTQFITIVTLVLTALLLIVLFN